MRRRRFRSRGRRTARGIRRKGFRSYRGSRRKRSMRRSSGGTRKRIGYRM